MELDIFFPREMVAFEYQGEQHYSDAYNIGPQWAYLQRDQEKRLACSQKGITLIEIPYWWDHSKQSLLATIHKYRPDLVTTMEITADPISSEPSEGFPNRTYIFYFVS